MKQVFLIPNVITAFGLACGLFVIFKVNMVEPGSGTYQMLHASALLLLLAALADMIDGAVARAINAVSEFGSAFDSLADAVSFGVAPAVLLLKSLSLKQGTPLSFYAIVGVMLYTICGVLRLVRFNVNLAEVKDTKRVKAKSKQLHFTGLPIPAAALAAVSLNLFLASRFGNHLFDFTTKSIVLSSAMILLGYLMICRFKFPSVKALHFRVPSFQLVILTVIFAIFILYGILYFFPVVLGIVMWGYVLLAIVFAVLRLVVGKKSKHFQDFEPDDD